jgi:hypothetical protein
MKTPSPLYEKRDELRTDVEFVTVAPTEPKNPGDKAGESISPEVYSDILYIRPGGYRQWKR